MSCNNRGMDGKDNPLGNFRRGSEDTVIRGLFFILGAIFLFQKFGDQGEYHAHPVLFVQVNGAGGDTQGLHGRDNPQAQQPALGCLHLFRTAVVQMLGCVLDPGRGLRGLEIKQDFRHEKIEGFVQLHLEPDLSAGNGLLPCLIIKRNLNGQRLGGVFRGVQQIQPRSVFRFPLGGPGHLSDF